MRTIQSGMNPPDVENAAASKSNDVSKRYFDKHNSKCHTIEKTAREFASPLSNCDQNQGAIPANQGAIPAEHRAENQALKSPEPSSSRSGQNQGKIRPENQGQNLLLRKSVKYVDVSGVKSASKWTLNRNAGRLLPSEGVAACFWCYIGNGALVEILKKGDRARLSGLITCKMRRIQSGRWPPNVEKAANSLATLSGNLYKSQRTQIASKSTQTQADFASLRCKTHEVSKCPMI